MIKLSRLLLGLCLISACEHAFAASSDFDERPSIKVLKVKGNRAVILFSKDRMPLTKGMVGTVVESAPEKLEVNSGEGASKANFIGLEGGFSILTTKIDGAPSDIKSDKIDLSVIYGWNTGTFEFGPLINLAHESSNTSDKTTYEVGGQFDFNFVPNDLENSIVYSARLVGAIGQQDTSTQEKSTTSFRVEPGVVVKWFGLDPNLAALASLSYQIESLSAETAKSTTDGIKLRLGIQTYF